MGYIISDKKIKINPVKIRAIKKWLTPRNIFEVLFFLGFTNFYYRFIKEYSKIILNLTNLTRKDAAWNWNDDAEQAFQGLKK